MTRVTKMEHRALCLYVLTNSISLRSAQHFVKNGVFRLLKRWIKVAEEEDCVDELCTIVKLCKKLPFDTQIVKETEIGKAIKKLLKFKSETTSVEPLYSEVKSLMELWLDCVKKGLSIDKPNPALALPTSSLPGIVKSISERLTREKGAQSSRSVGTKSEGGPTSSTGSEKSADTIPSPRSVSSSTAEGKPLHPTIHPKSGSKNASIEGDDHSSAMEVTDGETTACSVATGGSSLLSTLKAVTAAASASQAPASSTPAAGGSAATIFSTATPVPSTTSALPVPAPATIHSFPAVSGFKLGGAGGALGGLGGLGGLEVRLGPQSMRRPEVLILLTSRFSNWLYPLLYCLYPFKIIQKRLGLFSLIKRKRKTQEKEK
jgi:cell division septation protein DedD